MRSSYAGKATLPVLLISVSTFTGCTIPLKPPPAISYDDAAQPAGLETDPPKSVEIVEVPKLLPLPGQLKPIHGAPSKPEPGDPRKRVEKANAAARVQPSRNGYINAVQVYPFASGALYQVYAAPGQVTDVALQEGEQLVGSGPVAAGDTVRWIMGDTESGTGPTKRIHILVKPTRPDLVSNLVINTDRRTYLVELRSADKTYMASVSWQYPEDQLIALRRQSASAEAATPVATGVDVSRLRFRYASRATIRPGVRFPPSTTAPRSISKCPAELRKGRRRRCSSSGPKATGNSSITASIRTTTSSIVYSLRPSSASGASISRPFASAAPMGARGEHRQSNRQPSGR